MRTIGEFKRLIKTVNEMHTLIMGKPRKKWRAGGYIRTDIPRKEIKKMVDECIRENYPNKDMLTTEDKFYNDLQFVVEESGYKSVEKSAKWLDVFCYLF